MSKLDFLGDRDLFLGFVFKLVYKPLTRCAVEWGSLWKGPSLEFTCSHRCGTSPLSILTDSICWPVVTKASGIPVHPTQCHHANVPKAFISISEFLWWYIGLQQPPVTTHCSVWFWTESICCLSRMTVSYSFASNHYLFWSIWTVSDP